MLLVINANNTNTKFALHDGRNFVGQWRGVTDARRTADDYAAWLLPLLQQGTFPLPEIHGVVIACVVPQALPELRRLSHDYIRRDAVLIGAADVDPGIMLDVDRPHEVGADRIANAVGGFIAHGGPLIVVDLGTATTFDVIDGAGNYCGGTIAPGVAIGLEALHLRTAQLPRLALSKPVKIVGRDTPSAILSGTYWGYVGLIEGMARRIQEERGEAMKIVATGGLAGLFQDTIPALRVIDPDLTMRGLVEIFNRNHTKRGS